MKIVIDTNIVVSAIVFGGNPQKLLELLLDGYIEAVISPEISDEYRETLAFLQDKYSDHKVRFPLDHIIASMKIIIPAADIHICRDSNDDKFISCAVDGKCSYIISGDKDLLSLQHYNNIEILTVTDFLQRYKSSI